MGVARQVWCGLPFDDSLILFSEYCLSRVIEYRVQLVDYRAELARLQVSSPSTLYEVQECVVYEYVLLLLRTLTALMDIKKTIPIFQSRYYQTCQKQAMQSSEPGKLS